MIKRCEAWLLARLLYAVMRLQIGCEWLEPRITARLQEIGRQ